MVTEVRASWRLVAWALILGHFAAAYSFSVLAMVFQILVDPGASRALKSGQFEDLAKVATAFGFMAPVAMLPASLLTSPFTWFAALNLRASAGVALAVGAAIGAAETGLLLVCTGGFKGSWNRPGLPGDPRTDMMIVVCGAAAGIAYAWVVWRLCIRAKRALEGDFDSDRHSSED